MSFIIDNYNWWTIINRLMKIACLYLWKFVAEGIKNYD